MPIGNTRDDLERPLVYVRIRTPIENYVASVRLMRNAPGCAMIARGYSACVALYKPSHLSWMMMTLPATPWLPRDVGHEMTDIITKMKLARPKS